MIRIVGLSATLPNYIDVAHFLRVNPYEGLFFFDGRFRPVPLGQTFIGIKGTGHVKQLHDMDTICYEKVLENVEQGHQVSQKINLMGLQIDGKLKIIRKKNKSCKQNIN